MFGIKLWGPDDPSKPACLCQPSVLRKLAFWIVAYQILVFAVFGGTGCGHNTLTAPDGGEVRMVSGLGFRVQAYNQEYLDAGGSVTQQHADLADRWWMELMTDLRAAGFPAEKTEPSKHAQWVFIYLHKSVDGDSSIIEPQRNQPVGGYYDQFKPAYHVPGDYINGPMLGRRPSAQPLKHEMLHHWCHRELGHMCMAPGASEWDGHHFAAPDGTDAWNLTWK